MKNILVTGSNGQLGKCLQNAGLQFPEFNFTFLTKTEMDISNDSSVAKVFNQQSFDYCINTAAYTQVDKAEKEQKLAFLINAEAVKNLASECSAANCCLIHISTDYVFNGEQETPYTENDRVDPINVYGASKLAGEKHIQTLIDEYFIIRTSWLYSQHGHNFFNSMRKFAAQGKELTITTEQTGSPTNANDLAQIILRVISTENKDFGIYHFSNLGKTTWYDFAKAIFKHSGLEGSVKLAQTNYYRTFAKRPKFSLLDTTKIEKTLGVTPLGWEESLIQLIKNDSVIN